MNIGLSIVILIIAAFVFGFMIGRIDDMRKKTMKEITIKRNDESPRFSIEITSEVIIYGMLLIALVLIAIFT